MRSFLLCCILFLSTAFSSPHNGGTLHSQREKVLQATEMYSDSPIVVPLQGLVPSGLQLNKIWVLKGYKQNISSTEYYRNFYAYRHRKPTLMPIYRAVECYSLAL